MEGEDSIISFLYVQRTTIRKFVVEYNDAINDEIISIVWKVP